MSHVVVLGAGLGGTIMAYELRDALGKAHRVSVVNNGSSYSFVPSNPWVAVGWRSREAIEVDLTKVFGRRGIELYPQGAKRVHPAEKRIDLNDGSTLSYDYLVIATGPDLAFDEIEGFGPAANTQSVCHVDHALQAKTAFDELVKNPGPVIIGAVQGASCFGPAYEFAFILDKALRDAKVRDKVPMTFVTSEPYIGHLGLDGVGDTKGLLESELRQHHIKWITNARVDKVEPATLHVSEIAEDGSVQRVHELPHRFMMMLPAFRGVEAVRGIEGLTNPRGFIVVDAHQRNPAFPQVFGIGGGRAEDRFHDRIHGHGDGPKHRPPGRRQGAGRSGHLERGLPRRFRGFGHRLRGAAADSAAQRQLVRFGQVGPHGQGGVRKVLPAQDPVGKVRAVLREARASGARDRQAEGRQDRPGERQGARLSAPPAGETGRRAAESGGAGLEHRKTHA